MTDGFRRLVALCCLTVFSGTFLFASPTVTVEPWNEDHFPSWAQDLRRTEIITLGSLPFTTLASTIGYTFWRYWNSGFDPQMIPNPLEKTSEGARLDTDEQMTILGIAVAGSILFGLTDLAVTLYSRWRTHEDQKAELEKLQETVTIIPVYEEPAEED